jgi:hypothetical protein
MENHQSNVNEKIQILYSLTNTERDKIVKLFLIKFNVRYVKIKNNFGALLIEKFPLEYDEVDEIFFNKYSGKTVLIYTQNNDTFILEDDNYLIFPFCYDEII